MRSFPSSVLNVRSSHKATFNVCPINLAVRLRLGRLPHGPFTALNVAGDETAVMNGPEEIAAGMAAGIGDGVVIHHLFLHEVEIGPPRTAHAVWSMEDWIDRTEDRTVDPADMPFRTMRGYGHYHVNYVKTDRYWRIARLTLSRVRLDLT